MIRQFWLSLLLLGTTSVVAQQQFTVSGRVALPDGYTAGIVVNTDTAFAVSVGNETEIRDGRFTITGVISQPQPGTLMTNNLKLVERNHWPEDSIRWTYDDIFLSPGELTFTLEDKLTGTAIQTDYNEWLRGGTDASPWQFIETHPQSVVSVWLANGMMKRAYNLTAEEVALLERTVRENPADTARYTQFLRQLEAAKKTVKNMPVTNLELVDTNGQTCQLTEVVADVQQKHPGSYVLLDFWASWCGICIHSMPDVAQLVEDFGDRLCVVAVSIDTKPLAWKRAMDKHPHDWPQYCTSQRGYQDLFDKYQVGNGVPYYLLVSPEGRVLFSPERPDDVREVLRIKN